jgi:hypothetical protein
VIAQQIVEALQDVIAEGGGEFTKNMLERSEMRRLPSASSSCDARVRWLSR